MEFLPPQAERLGGAQNQQTANEMILRKLINSKYVYNTADINTLTSIANQCPISGGDAVYQARVLLMTIENNVIEFVDNCNEKPSTRSESGVSITATNQITALSTYKLYPNPNDGNMIFEYSLSAQSTGMFVLYDITGRMINKYKLTEGQSNSLKISESGLDNGVYFYSVIIDNTVKAYSKLVIVK